MEFSLSGIPSFLMKLYHTFFPNFDAERKDIEQRVDKILSEEVDKLIISAAKGHNASEEYAVNTVSFTNKTDVNRCFQAVYRAFLKIDHRLLMRKSKKKGEIKAILTTMPNNWRWLISIYCLQDNEESQKLAVLWKKYAGLVKLEPLQLHSPMEMANMDNDTEFQEIYADDSVEAEKFYYREKIEKLAQRLSKELGVLNCSNYF